MNNLNDFDFHIWLLNGEEFVLYTVLSDMEEVELLDIVCCMTERRM